MKEFRKGEFFSLLDNVFKLFCAKAKHNCGCISQVCIYKGIFRFWTALCGLLGDKCSIASSCLVHKTSTVHMAFFNSHRGAKQLLREANNPRNGGKQILRDSIQSMFFGRQNKSFRIQNNSFGRQINPVMEQYKSKPYVK